MLSEILYRLRILFRGRSAESELDEELAFHLEHETEKLLRSGFTPAEARRRARLAVGGPAQIKEEVRDEWIWRWCRDAAHDVRYAVRALRQSPTFTAVAVLSLALGIGANTAIFGILNAVILKPLPVDDPGALAHLITGREDGYTNAIWEQVRGRQDVFSSALAYSFVDLDLADGGERRSAHGLYVSGDYFRTLGLQPHAGRLLTNTDDRRDAPAVAVLSYGFWERTYGSDPQVAGRILHLNGHPFQIVGVAPRKFTGMDQGFSFDVMVPLAAEAIIDAGHPSLDERSAWWLTIVGRLKPGVSFAQAGARLAVLSPQIYGQAVSPDLPQEYRADFLKNRIDVRPVAGISYLRTQYGTSLAVLMGIAGLVLLIACVNIANLLLARSGARQREIAIRLAMGAGRGRLVRQLLTEGAVLALAGAACGGLLAQWAGPVIVSQISFEGARLFLDVSPDARVLAFTLGAALLTAILFALAPALQATRSATAESLKQTARSLTARQGRWSLGRMLVVVQIALSLVLLVGAGLFTGTLRNLANQNLGFRRDGVLIVQPDTRGAHYSDERMVLAADDLLGRLRAVPGVESATRAAVTPIGGGAWGWDVNANPADDSKKSFLFFNAVTPGYFATFGTPLLRGRDFSPNDTKDSPRVAILNEKAAREMFPGADPMGKVYYDHTMERVPKEFQVEVIGVVGDAKYLKLRDEAPAAAYLPITQDPSPHPTLGKYVLRFAGSPSALMNAVKDAVRASDPRISIDFHLLSEQIAAALMQERLVALLATFFGLLALVLASAGLYGVVAYSAARRRSEMAIRMALGASRRGVLRLMLAELAGLVVWGAPLGLAGSWAGARLVRSMLFGLAAGDPMTMALASGVLLLSALVAGYLPARRAARIDPMAALREE